MHLRHAHDELIFVYKFIYYMTHLRHAHDELRAGLGRGFKTVADRTSASSPHGWVHGVSGKLLPEADRRTKALKTYSAKINCR
jgi:hypothetical protein